MEFDIWKPLYADKFDCNKYLYHYTNFETAIKIICGNKLLFSPIGRTNDTSEAKLKIVFEQNDIECKELYREQVKKISEYFCDSTQKVQLLCFSMDAKISEKDKKQYWSTIGNKYLYYDVSGRGFALPRMWAQYASNNKGVCLVFNREKLEKLINKKIAFTKATAVKYKKFFDRYVIDKARMEILYERISMMSNGSLTLLDMIQKDNDFLVYNYFTKLDDWKNEHEYRIVALIDNQNNSEYRVPVYKISSCLEGVVIGEQIDLAYEEIIRMLIENKGNKCDVKKIQFNSNICKLV